MPTLTDVPAGHWAKDAIDRLVARGVLLGYPDGTFRGTQNLTRYEAAIIIARLLNQMGNGQGAGLDAETLTSLQNAVQELSADLAALGVRVGDLEGSAVSKEDFNRLEERVEALDGSDLKGLAGRYDELSANYDTLRADVDDNASSIAALNDLTVLLNQDVLNLQDRASALEAAQADFVTRTDFDALNTNVKSIDGRVTTLENAPKFSISGSLEGKYGNVNLTHSGAGDFDLDLLNAGSFIGDYFSNDSYCGMNSYKFNSPNATGGWQLGNGSIVNERTNKGVRCVDTSNNLSDITATITFGVTNLKTMSGAVMVNSAHVTLKAKHTTDPASIFAPDATGGKLGTVVDQSSETYAALAHADINGSTAAGVKFTVAFDDGNSSNSKFKFNDYLFANDNDTDDVVYRRGVQATVDASALSGLSPKIMFVAGNATPQLFTTTINGFSAQYPNSASLAPNATLPISQLEPLTGGYFGVRDTINPYNLGTIGLSYAQGNVNSTAYFTRRNAVSIDADLKYSPVTVKGAFVASYPGNADADLKNADKAGFIKFGADVSGVKLHANYRYIAPSFENGVASMSANDSYFYTGVYGNHSSAPFGSNEDGFGIDGSFNAGPFGVGAYVNSFKSIQDINAYRALNGARQTAYGVKVGSSVWRGASLTGFYNDAKVGDIRMSELYGNDTVSDWNNTDTFDKIDGFKYSNGSNYGINLRHDGSSKDALVHDLNIDATYARIYDDVQNIKEYKYDDFVIAANYKGKFGIATVTPFVRYHYFHNPLSGQAFAPAAKGSYINGSISNYEGAAHEQYSYNSYKVGLQVTTDPLDITTKPSLFAGVSYRNTDYDQHNDSTTELLANVGVSLNQFLFDSSKLSIGYSYYQGYNVDNHNYYDGISRSYNPFNSGNDVISGNTSNMAWYFKSRDLLNRTISGVYGQWEAWGLKAAYGFYRFDNLNTNQYSTAQAFKVSAKLNF